MYIPYKEHFDGNDPVAIKLHQHEINAPMHGHWGTFVCDACKADFALGPHRIYPNWINEQECVARLERLLAEDHKASREHQNVYALG